MARKEAINEFKDGLIKDLNPINTPNTALTDCVNGTIITYNGNEHSLQNDMGNYPLKYCKLKTNYIPVGLKEYGDILYIVSYNPLDEHVEIGSYPSPETITDSDDLDNLSQTVDEIIAKMGSSANYTTLSGSGEKLKVFYAEIPDKSKLNPGDMYKLDITGDAGNKYESIEYYVIDEDKKLYNVTDKVVVNDSNFRHIEWDVPGWLAIKKHLASLDDFRINVKKIVVPSYSNTVTMELNLQAISTDTLINASSSITSDLKVQIEVSIDGASPIYSVKEPLSRFVDMKNGQFVYYTEYNPETFTANANSTITVTATPMLSVGSGKEIVYDNLMRSINFNISNKGDVNSFKIGEASWWYKTSAEDNTFLLKFDTEGLSDSSVLSEDVYLFYSLQRIVNNTSTSLENLPYVTDNKDQQYKNQRLYDWTILGETIIEFPLEKFTSVNWGNYPNRFYPEDVYIMTFKFYNTSSPDFTKDPLKSVTKLITATELMNDFKESRYDTITFDRWINKYADSIRNNNFVVDNYSTDESQQTVDKTALFTENYNIWHTGNNQIAKYSAYISSINDNKFKQGFDASAGISCPTTVTYRNKTKLLTGPMWLDFISKLKTAYTLQETRDVMFDQYTGENGSTYTETISSKFAKKKHYSLQQLDDPLTIWNYEVKSLNVPSSDDFKVTCYGNINNDVAKGSITFNSGGISSQNIPETEDLTRKSGTRNFTINSIPSLLSKIDNNSSYKYDVLFINMRAGGEGSNKWEGCKLWCNGLSGEKNYSSVCFRGDADPHPNQGWGPEYDNYYGFAVFNLNGKLGFVPLKESSTYSNFYNWVSDVEHIVCTSDSELRGSFYHASPAGDSTADSTFTFVIRGEISPTSFNFKGKNLFTSARNSVISSNWVSNLENFTVENDIIGIPAISITEYEGSIFVPVSFGPQIDALLAAADQTISNYNTQVIDAQRNNLSMDTVYTTEGMTSSSNIYQYKKGASHTDAALLNLLNRKTGIMASTTLEFMYKNVSYSQHFDIKGQWGNLDPGIEI